MNFNKKIPKLSCYKDFVCYNEKPGIKSATNLVQNTTRIPFQICFLQEKLNSNRISATMKARCASPPPPHTPSLSTLAPRGVNPSGLCEFPCRI